MHLSQKTKDLLELVVMTSMDTLTKPRRLHATLTDYAGWNHPSSYLRQMRAIREKGLLSEIEPNKTTWIPELTSNGIDAIAEQVDPERFWDQTWDGLWRTITFDLPTEDRKERQRLNTWLRNKRFGHLQGSLWLSTRPYDQWNEQIVSLNIDPRAVIFIEGKPLGPLSDNRVVQHSWPFEKVHTRYQEYQHFLDNKPPSVSSTDVSTSLADWFKQESRLWRAATELDPMLPHELHPENYLGGHCWRARKRAFQVWTALLNT